MTNVMGIDPSLRGLAIAICGPKLPLHVQRWTSDPGGGDESRDCLRVHERCNRYRVHSRGVLALAAKHNPMVVIEGYAFSQNQGGGHALIEFGGILRDRLTFHCATIVELGPMQLKLFAAGSGRADKREIGKELKDRYGRTFDSHDEADAFVCMQVGLCLLDQREPCTWFEREVIAKLRGQPVAKRVKGTHRNQRELTT